MANATGSVSSPGLGVGNVVGDCFSLTFKNLLRVAAVVALPFLIIGVLGAAVFGAGMMTGGTDLEAMLDGVTADPLQFGLMLVVYMVVVSFLICFVFAAGVRLYFDLKVDCRASILSAYRSGLARAVPLFIVNVVFMIILIIALGLPMALFAAIDVPALGLLLLPAFLYLGGVMAPLAPAVVVEARWISAIGRSIQLTKDYRWPIVGAMLLMYLIMFGISLVALPIAAMFAFAGVIGIVLAAIANVAINVLIYGLLIALLTVIYTRLREIKEGTSIESVAGIFD
ncbi:MAG: hypothetical protein AAGJ28_11970 [Pseudomonadota bacterium]